MPAPVIARLIECATELTVNALAPELKTMPLSVVSAESDMAGVLERAKVAMSLDPFGTVAGVQLAAVFQSLLVGFGFHVALPAKLF